MYNFQYANAFLFLFSFNISIWYHCFDYYFRVKESIDMLRTHYWRRIWNGPSLRPETSTIFNTIQYSGRREGPIWNDIPRYIDTYICVTKNTGEYHNCLENYHSFMVKCVYCCCCLLSLPPPITISFQWMCNDNRMKFEAIGWTNINNDNRIIN